MAGFNYTGTTVNQKSIDPRLIEQASNTFGLNKAFDRLEGYRKEDIAAKRLAMLDQRYEDNLKYQRGRDKVADDRVLAADAQKKANDAAFNEYATGTTVQDKYNTISGSGTPSFAATDDGIGENAQALLDHYNTRQANISGGDMATSSKILGLRRQEERDRLSDERDRRDFALNKQVKNLQMRNLTGQIKDAENERNYMPQFLDTYTQGEDIATGKIVSNDDLSDADIVSETDRLNDLRISKEAEAKKDLTALKKEYNIPDLPKEIVDMKDPLVKARETRKFMDMHYANQANQISNPEGKIRGDKIKDVLTYEFSMGDALGYIPRKAQSNYRSIKKYLNEDGTEVYKAPDAVEITTDKKIKDLTTRRNEYARKSQDIKNKVGTDLAKAADASKFVKPEMKEGAKVAKSQAEVFAAIKANRAGIKDPSLRNASVRKDWAKYVGSQATPEFMLDSKKFAHTVAKDVAIQETRDYNAETNRIRAENNKEKGWKRYSFGPATLEAIGDTDIVSDMTSRLRAVMEAAGYSYADDKAFAEAIRQGEDGYIFSPSFYLDSSHIDNIEEILGKK